MKKIFILMMLLLLTGCSIDYELNITEDGIFENLSGNISKNEFDDISEPYGDLNIYFLLHNHQQVFDNSDKEFYNQNISESDDIVEFNYSYNYDKNFNNSRLLNTCFDNVEFKETDNYYYLSVYGQFNCQYADKIVINISSDYIAIDNNAEKVINNKYIWTLKEGKTTDILLMLSKNIKYDSNKSNTGSTISTFQVIGIIIFVIVSLIAFIIYKKRNSEN